jgi:hypothetical protein
MNPIYSTVLRVFLFSLITLLLLSACTNPASNDADDHDDHEHAVGAVLEMNGAEIVRIEEGQVQSGQIEVTEGDETPLITIYFLAEDGDKFQPDEPDYSLRWEQIDEAVAEVEQHNQDGKWGFHIHGLQSGSTSVVFKLWHDSAGHEDYFTPEIDIIVN